MLMGYGVMCYGKREGGDLVGVTGLGVNALGGNSPNFGVQGVKGGVLLG